jgi:FAD/FMN-containing dehydrogenase
MAIAVDAGDLAGIVRGRVITPDSADYDAARRVWNGMIDRRPALIVECAGAADVVAALEFARREGLPIAARGGGHGVAGKAVVDDGVVIDLSEMDGVHVDPKARTARVGAGATWSQVDRESQAFGLAVTGGVDSRTGVAGLTLGGGIGHLARAHGLTIDSLLSAEVVLADGRVVTASDGDHPDLFWALRGGGGNFGVVTSFEFRLQEVGPEVMTAQVFHPMEGAAEAVAFYREFMAGAPDEVGCFALFVNVPPVEPFPADQHGRTCLALVACHAGDLDEGEEILRPMGSFGSPMLSVVAPMPYVTLQSSFDAGAPDGGRYYWKATYLDEISDDLIATVVGGVESLPGPYSNVFFEPLGGAVSRVDSSATAFPHRGAGFGLGLSTGWEDPAADGAAMAWTRDLYEAVAVHGSGGAYSNYLDHDDAGLTGAAWGPNYPRLQQVKAAYDPEDLFHGNVEIAPG